jgi:hypothetical protein
MHWFRSRSSLGSWVALFALTFQLAVSFGHVHLDRVVAGSGSASASSGAHTVTDAIAAFDRGDGQSPGLADDYCAICALMDLASTAVPSAPPDLPPPVLFGRLRSEPNAEFELAAPNHAPFAARAPPLA